MRLILVFALFLPATAAAQIDLTATPKSAGHSIRILQQHVGPETRASVDPAEWCIADAYRLLAGQITDPRLEAASRRAAAQFEAAGSRRIQQLPGGLAVTEGREAVVRVTDRAICRTRVRVAATRRG